MNRPGPPYLDVTVGDLMVRLAADLPDNEALIYPGRDLRMTFSELEGEVRLIARGLMALGVERGERVAVWSTNLPEWIILQFALARIGAILVTVNTSLRSHEIDYLLRQSEAATLFTIRGFREVDYIANLREIGAVGDDIRLPDLKRVLFIPRNDADECPEGLMPYEELRRMAGSVSEEQLVDRETLVNVDDVINMQYTSGTTGFPKGVMLSSRNILNNGYWLGQGLGYTPQDRLCLCVPLFHCFGCVIGVLGAYSHGAVICMVEYFDPEKVLEAVHRERCTAIYGVPTMFLAEMDHPQFKNYDMTSLRTGMMAGSLCPEILMRRAIDEMNLRELTIAYGLTEASPGITMTSRTDTIENRTQTVGKVLPEMEVRIVDPVTRAPLGIDQPGELCVRGYNIMNGYYNNPEATSAAIDQDGWLRTGDEATIDKEGYVRITGRIKDIIIRGGENIAPREIEDLLRRNEAVSDVYVYGISSEFFGEEVAAAVKLKPGCSVTEKDLQDFCSDEIARFKIPRHFRFVDDFPMTASGKIQKFKLREIHEKEVESKK